MRTATGFWIVLSATGKNPDYLAGRYDDVYDAEDCAARLRNDGEDARVVAEYSEPEVEDYVPGCG